MMITITTAVMPKKQLFLFPFFPSDIQSRPRSIRSLAFAAAIDRYFIIACRKCQNNLIAVKCLSVAVKCWIKIYQSLHRPHLFYQGLFFLPAYHPDWQDYLHAKQHKEEQPHLQERELIRDNCTDKGFLTSLWGLERKCCAAIGRAASLDVRPDDSASPSISPPGASVWHCGYLSTNEVVNIYPSTAFPLILHTI